MESSLVVAARLYVPLLLGFVCLLGALFYRKDDRHPLARLKLLPSLFEIEVPVPRSAVARVVFAALVPVCLFSYLFFDYSSFFPKHFSVEVFYDEPGLRSSLDVLSSRERAQLRIAEPFDTYRHQYFRLLDQEIRSLLRVRQFFTVTEGAIHSTGQTTFFVEKISAWQKYHIMSSDGKLKHRLETPGLPPLEFQTLFEKLPTRDDYFEVSAVELFFRHSVILRPQFKQVLADARASQEVVFRFSVVGLTKVSIFPWPSVSNTVYCAKFPDVGLVPVAYAIYR